MNRRRSRSAQRDCCTAQDLPSNRSCSLTPGVLLALAAVVLAVVANPLAPLVKRATYEDTAVQQHNTHRASHSAPDIAWDAGLSQSAATLAGRCAVEHDTSIGGGGYGQNIAAGSGADGDLVGAVAAAITDMWYDGEVAKFANEYGKTNPSTSYTSWGHFTQVVWKASTHVGCATHQCAAGTVFNNDPALLTICNYAPAGNVDGQYAANVGRPGGGGGDSQTGGGGDGLTGGGGDRQTRGGGDGQMGVTTSKVKQDTYPAVGTNMAQDGPDRGGRKNDHHGHGGNHRGHFANDDNDNEPILLPVIGT